MPPLSSIITLSFSSRLVSGAGADHREPQVSAVAQGEGHRRAAPRRDVLRRPQVGQEGRLPRRLGRTSRYVRGF